MSADEVVDAIGVVPGQATSVWKRIPLEEAKKGSKIAVVERHHATGNVGVAPIVGFGLLRGAIASTVAHDSHNIVVVGTNDTDMLEAVQALRNSGGGLVVVDGQVLRHLPLSIGGLMANATYEEVARDYVRVLDAAKGLCDGTLENPFMTLSFLPLAVIPELKLTDLGLVDVVKGQLVANRGVHVQYEDVQDVDDLYPPTPFT